MEGYQAFLLLYAHSWSFQGVEAKCVEGNLFDISGVTLDLVFAVQDSFSWKSCHLHRLS